MKRRDFLSLFGGAMAGGGALGGIAVLPRPAWSQTAKVYRVGTLTVGPPIPPTAGTGKILVEGLEQRGFTLGQNLAYEARGGAGERAARLSVRPKPRLRGAGRPGQREPDGQSDAGTESRQCRRGGDCQLS